MDPSLSFPLAAIPRTGTEQTPAWRPVRPGRHER